MTTKGLQGTSFDNINVDNGVKVGLSDNAVVGIVGAMANLATQNTAQANANAQIVAKTQQTTTNFLASQQSNNKNLLYYAVGGILVIALFMSAMRKRRKR